MDPNFLYLLIRGGKASVAVVPEIVSLACAEIEPSSQEIMTENESNATAVITPRAEFQSMQREWTRTRESIDSERESKGVTFACD
jgi:hypothetical protein